MYVIAVTQLATRQQLTAATGTTATSAERARLPVKAATKAVRRPCLQRVMS